MPRYNFNREETESIIEAIDYYLDDVLKNYSEEQTSTRTLVIVNYLMKSKERLKRGLSNKEK